MRPPQTTPRPRRRVLASAAGAAAVLATAGCGIEPTGVQVVGAPPPAQAAANPGSGSGNGNYLFYLYFFRNGHLASTVRSSPIPVDQETVIAALIKGPNAAEQAQNFITEVPKSLRILSLTAQGEAWAYQFSDEVGREERAEIVCSIQANLPAPSVATVYGDGKPVWNICWEDFPDLGAPAYLPNAADIDSAGPPAQPASPLA